MYRVQALNVNKGDGKRYIIPDIHACIKTFDSLLKIISLQKSDQLFLLGDYIDRGPSGIGVIDILINLQDQGFQIYPVRGNHEEEILLLNEYNQNLFVRKQISKYIDEGFFDSNFRLKSKYLKFFNSMPYYIESENLIMVHAGFNFRSTKPFEDTDSMLGIRDWHYDQKVAKNKTIVHGHSPKKLFDIQLSIEEKKKVIALDNGCIYNQFEGMGNLLCLNPDNFELLVQSNLDNKNT
jgi:serine/threonine protein phosphatase 1